MKKAFREALENSPVIAAIKDEEGLKKCLTSESQVIFILYGDILTIPQIVQTVKSSGKLAMVHIDLITGLSNKEVSVDFLKQYTLADGIITTRPNLINHAKKIGFYTVLRFFLIDSMAYENIERQVKSTKPDVIEVLPAMAKIVSKICAISPTPVIAGGLVSDKEDVITLLQAGVTSVSTTTKSLWFI